MPRAPTTTRGRCGKNHIGQCRWAVGTCFKCGKAGHMIRDCPLLQAPTVVKPVGNDQSLRVRGRVYAVTEQDVGASRTVVAGILQLFS